MVAIGNRLLVQKYINMLYIFGISSVFLIINLSFIINHLLLINLKVILIFQISFTFSKKGVVSSSIKYMSHSVCGLNRQSVSNGSISPLEFSAY